MYAETAGAVAATATSKTRIFLYKNQNNYFRKYG